jgi:hypothetical protein
LGFCVLVSGCEKPAATEKKAADKKAPEGMEKSLTELSHKEVEAALNLSN